MFRVSRIERIAFERVDLEKVELERVEFERVESSLCLLGNYSGRTIHPYKT